MSVKKMAAAAFAGIFAATASSNAFAFDIKEELKNNPEGAKAVVCAVYLTSAKNLVGQKLAAAYNAASLVAAEKGQKAYGSSDVFRIKALAFATEYAEAKSLTLMAQSEVNEKEVEIAERCVSSYGIK